MVEGTDSVYGFFFFFFNADVLNSVCCCFFVIFVEAEPHAVKEGEKTFYYFHLNYI